MSLATNITNLATRIATELKAIRTLINGNVTDLSGLNTATKSNLVAALNELKAGLDAAPTINDTGAATTSTWSSSKITSQIDTAIAALVGGAPDLLNTLKELADAIGEDQNILDSLNAAVAVRVRFDIAQALSEAQKTTARANIGAAAEGHIHSDAAQGQSGFMSGADKTKLDGVATGANNYVHPTGDGNRHVPATVAGDVSKWLKSAAAAGGAAIWSAITKADVGLGNVDNTSDVNKPISSATQTALDGKLPTSHAGSGGTAHANAVAGGAAGFMTGADKTKLDGVANNANNYSHPTGDGNLHVPATGTTNNGKVLKAGATAGSMSWSTVTKTDVGLANVDNTADNAKPVSTAQQTALDLKADKVDVGDTTTDFVATFNAGLV